MTKKTKLKKYTGTSCIFLNKYGIMFNMAERKLKFENGEYYHIYNRGVDKRNIFLDYQDTQYFIDRIQDFNTIEIFGNAAQMKYGKNKKRVSRAYKKNIVEIIAYAINPNHFHLVLKQIRSDKLKKHNGISNLMQRVGTGYSMYFNKKYKRNGALFQGKFKAVKVYNDDHLQELVAYVNFNYKIHKLNRLKHIIKTSMGEYLNKDFKQVCWKKNILSKFKGREDFQKYTQKQIGRIIKERNILKTENF